MNSSYNNTLDYGDLIKYILFSKQPKKIVEFGILDGYSLKIFTENTTDCEIKAFDIFDEFNGNSANKSIIIDKFKEYKNITIEYGNFYNKINDFNDNDLDIIHIDIANNGDVYKFAIDNYMSKIKKGGIMILEGGSKERDNIEWMIKYNKPKIKQYLKTIKYETITIGKIPSITIIKNN
jgi:predicted O-methyltransferase YrrM